MNLFTALGMIFLVSFLLTCKKEKDKPITKESVVSFSIRTPNLKNATTLKDAESYAIGDAKKVLLTIQNTDGNSTIYTSSELIIEQINGIYFTQKIILNTGSYNLTEFNLLDSTGKTIFAAPLAGSKEAQNVSNPLPIAFNVSENVSTTIGVEVLSTENQTPEDFGFSTFSITEINLFSFMIGVTDKNSNNLVSAKLTVTNGSYSYVQNLDSIVNNIVTIRDSLTNYTLTIEKSGYKTYSKIYPIDSLKQFTNEAGNVPLLIELEKIQAETVTDIDGNIYQTVTIGNQVWMKENLKTTKYNDGTPIPLVSDNTNWSNLASPAYCWLNNDESSFKNIYGALYNWYVVNSGKLAPTGWHIPSDVEWTTLKDFLGGGSIAGGKLKEVGTIHWFSPNTGADNTSGFSALPGGSRDAFAVFYGPGTTGAWWTATENASISAYCQVIYYNGMTIGRGQNHKRYGMSIRCIKD